MAEANSNKPQVWKKAQDSDADDVWDDSIIIKAYEKQKRLVEQALKAKAKTGIDRNSDPNLRSPSSSDVRKVTCDQPALHCGSVIPKMPLFAVGNPCRCVYSADGLEYEAEIVELFEDKGQCLVRYVGYANEELKKISDMKSSRGEDARIKQTEESQAASIWDEKSDLLQMPSSPEPDIVPVSSRSEVNKVISSIAEQEKSSLREDKNKYQKKSWTSKDKLVNESIILPYRKMSSDSVNRIDACSSTTGKSPAARMAPASSTSSSLPHHVWQAQSSSASAPPLPPGLLSGREEDEALASMLMAWYMSGYHTGYYEAMKKYKK